MHKKGKFFVISAPSGAGKTTIIKNVLNSFPDIVFSVSATTRKIREGEKDGVDYFFLSEEDFLEKIDNDEFVEWEKCYGYYYGTLKSFINKNVEDGKSVLLEVDVKGAISIKRIYNDALLIFINPPSINELKNRLENRRTETSEDIAKRIERAEMELRYIDQFDYIVDNSLLENAVQEIKKIIEENKQEK